MRLQRCRKPKGRDYPIIFCSHHEYPELKESNRLPAYTETRIAYANPLYYKHPRFDIIQQWYKTKHAYFNHIEIYTETPIRLWVSCAEDDLFWSYQLKGKSEFNSERGEEGGFVFNEAQYRVTWSPPGRFEYRVEAGTHKLFFFILESGWIMEMNQAPDLIRAMAQKKRKVGITPPMQIDNRIYQHVLYLFSLGDNSGFSQITNILDPIGKLVDRSFEDVAKKQRPYRGSFDVVYKVREYISKLIGKGPIPPLSTIATHFGISTAHLRRLHQDVFKNPLRTYIINEKLAVAKRLLEIEGRSVSYVAYKLHYRDVSSFSRQFKRYYGLPPSKVMLKQR